MAARSFISLIYALSLVISSINLSPLPQTINPPTEQVPPFPARERYEQPFMVGQAISNAQAVTPALLQGMTTIWDRFVFQGPGQSSWDVFLYYLDGGNIQIINLTNDAIHDYAPRLSPDLHKVVFYSKRGGNDYEICVYNLDNGVLTQITNNGVDDINPAWSPDSQQIVYESYPAGSSSRVNGEIFKVSVDGSNNIRLTNNKAYDGMPAWSPDGKQIAFVRSKQGGFENIWIMDKDGKNPYQRTTGYYDWYPAWSPSGHQIAYSTLLADYSFHVNYIGDSDYPYGGLGCFESSDCFVNGWSDKERYISVTSAHYTGNYYDGYLSYAGYIQANYPEPNYYPLDLNSISNAIPFFDWKSTDPLAPITTIQPLPPVSPAPVQLYWSCRDQAKYGTPSGIMSYDIQYKSSTDDNWQEVNAVTSTSYTFEGQAGITYTYRVRARDAAGNIEDWKAENTWTTTIESLPPRVILGAVPRYASYQNGITIGWSAWDPGGSSIVDYEVRHRTASMNSDQWITDASSLTDNKFYFYDSQLLQDYYFQVRAKDRANSYSEWVGNTDPITFYRWELKGTQYDNQGTPVSGGKINPELWAPYVETPGIDGRFRAYVMNDYNNYQATWTKEEYGELPETGFGFPETTNIDIVYPPKDNVVANGGFENSTENLQDWTVSGENPPFLSYKDHTGNYAAFVGKEIPFSSKPLVAITTSSNLSTTTDDIGNFYMVYPNYLNLVAFLEKTSDGNWQPEITLSTMGSIEVHVHTKPLIAIDSQHGVHVVFTDRRSIYYTHRDSNGIWSDPVVIYDNQGDYLTNGFDLTLANMLIDNKNKLHLVGVRQNNTGISVIYQEYSAGNWSGITLVSVANSNNKYPTLSLSKNQLPIIAWVEESSDQSSIYINSTDDGINWGTQQKIVGPLTLITMETPQLFIDSTGRAILVITQTQKIDYRTNEMEILDITKEPDGSWSQPNLIHKTRGVINQTQALLAPDNSLQLTWLETNSLRSSGVYFTTYESVSGWSAPMKINSSQNGGIGDGYAVAIDNELTTHFLISYNGNWGKSLVYMNRYKNGIWSVEQHILDNYSEAIKPGIISTGGNGFVNLLWFRDRGTTFYNVDVFHSGISIEAQSSSSVLDQKVFIPTNVVRPGLSFMYLLADAKPGITGLKLTVDDGISITDAWQTQTNTGPWSHQWIDMSPWSGKEVTISFTVNAEPGFPAPQAYIDEVSLGSTRPDLWVTVDPSTADVLAGDEITLRLDYGNHGVQADQAQLQLTLTPELEFVEATLAPTSQNGAISWDLGTLGDKASGEPIYVTIRVKPEVAGIKALSATVQISSLSQELETLNNTVSTIITTETFLFIPLVQK
jgi:hypothetical protein